MTDTLDERWKVLSPESIDPQLCNRRGSNPVWVEEGLESVSTVLGEHVFPRELCKSEVVKSPKQLSLNAVQSEWAKHALSIGRKMKLLFGFEFSICQMILCRCKFRGSPCRKGRDNLCWSERLLSETLEAKNVPGRCLSVLEIRFAEFTQIALKIHWKYVKYWNDVLTACFAFWKWNQHAFAKVKYSQEQSAP